ncbi:MAG: hypothetical protein AAF790_04000 [Planctomycetota bacterium]
MPPLTAPNSSVTTSATLLVPPVLAQESDEDERGYSWEVALIMLCIVLGMLVAVRPSKRKAEFKKPAQGD